MKSHQFQIEFDQPNSQNKNNSQKARRSIRLFIALLNIEFSKHLKQLQQLNSQTQHTCINQIVERKLATNHKSNRKSEKHERSFDAFLTIRRKKIYCFVNVMYGVCVYGTVFNVKHISLHALCIKIAHICLLRICTACSKIASAFLLVFVEFRSKCAINVLRHNTQKVCILNFYYENTVRTIHSQCVLWG